MNLKKILTSTIVMLGLLGGTLGVFAQGPATQKEKPPEGTTPKPFTLPKRETFTLKNGIKVTLVPYGLVPKVLVTAVVRTGNLNESENQTWLANIVANMLKEGTTTRTNSQIAEEAARMGGSVNVGIGNDTTSVNGDVLSEFGPQLVALLADVIQNPSFPESELARMKTDRLRQLTIARTQPGSLANERFRKILYPDHPYGRVYPTEAMIKGFTAADVKKFYTDNFGAARTNLYVVGQFDAAAMRKALTQGFEGWTRGSDAVMNVPKPAAARTLHLIDRPGAAQSTLYVGLPVIDTSHPDYTAFFVMNAILGGSFGSRITANIREQKGYTYSPTSIHSVRYRDAYWVEVADVTTAVTGPSLKEIFFEIERLQKEPPTADELQGIKNYLAGIFVIQNSSRGGITGQLAALDLHGLSDDFLTTFVQRIYAVTPQAVQRMAQKYITPDKMAIVVVGDKSKIAEQLTTFGKIVEN
jgi:predicted Zn-dependent peptidase